MERQYSHMDDQQLLDNFYNDHDNKWLGVLFERYTLLLFGLCMKYLKNEEEAKDAVQQVFLKSVTELHKYKVQFFKSWLYMVAKNLCLMKLRDRGKTFLEIHDRDVRDETDPAAINAYIEKDRQLDLMSESLEKLNFEQKRCITLFYLEKKSYNEISEETGYSVMQVKSYIQNGKRNLKLLMEKNSSNQ